MDNVYIIRAKTTKKVNKSEAPQEKLEVWENERDAKKRVEEIIENRNQDIQFTYIDDIQIETHIIQRYL